MKSFPDQYGLVLLSSSRLAGAWHMSLTQGMYFLTAHGACAPTVGKCVAAPWPGAPGDVLLGCWQQPRIMLHIVPASKTKNHGRDC